MKRALVISLLCFGLTAAAAGPKPARNPQPPSADSAYVTTLLSNGDKDSLNEAVTCIGELIEMQPAVAVSQARSSWLPSLIGAKRYEDVQRLAMAAMVEVAADTSALEELQRLRIKAYLSAGQPDQAVVAAKGLFNICSMGTTRGTLTQLAECLSAANPLDPSIVNRLRQEQLAGAVSEVATSDIILRISLDPTPWQAGLLRYDPERYTIAANPYRNLTARGNMLLLSGRADDARAVFERAKAFADEDFTLQANENIARSIKAQHGCIGPANSFIRKLRQ